ncbi:MAG: adenylate cyclase [Lachnospiraceae bacterium]|nr:adenylate cyclase [Lachnospiraceae bacterium]
MSLEIERKFLMEDFPNLPCMREVYIEQGYLSIEPEVRIHKAIDKQSGKQDFRLTVRGNGTLTRTEIKTDVEEAFYKEAVELLGLPMIKKEYKSYTYEGYVLEVCYVDAGMESAFFYGEIEFPSEEEANTFQKPYFLGKEVTMEDDYKMKNYWKRTRGV